MTGSAGPIPRQHAPVPQPEGHRPSFRQAYSGRFSGLLKWDDLDAVFALVKAAPEWWWIYDTRTVLPATTTAPADVERQLDDITTFLRQAHKADYCGFVYVDDRTCPTFIKVYDPRNASSCSLGTPVPVFTLSHAHPEQLPLQDGKDAARTSGRGLLRRVFGGKK